MSEDNENTEQQATKKPSKLKFILIGIIILILILLILVVVFMFVLAPKNNTEEQAAQAPMAQPQAVAPAPAPQAVQQPVAPAPIGMDMSVSNAEMGQIYPIPTLNVNLADPTGITYLAITLELEFDPKNSNLYSEVESKMPRIIDMIITILSSKAYEEISTSQGKVNLKNEFLRRINSMLAKGRLYNVYITGFTVQR